MANLMQVLALCQALGAIGRSEVVIFHDMLTEMPVALAHRVDVVGGIVTAKPPVDAGQVGLRRRGYLFPSQNDNKYSSG
jgi:hypothetical protein